MIEIRTFGRTVVSVDGEELSGEAAWPKSLALLVYMAREPGPDRREEILGVLWPDRDAKRARRSLNQLIYTLRKANPPLDLESVSGALDFGSDVWLDVEEFERRLEEGDLKGAVALYQGPFLLDLDIDVPEMEHWADRQRADLRRKFRKAALELAESSLAAGDDEGAASYCRRMIQSDPLDDEAQHLLIDSLYRAGDRVGALRQFERYRDLLAKELQVEPLDSTLELVERIRDMAAEDDTEEVDFAWKAEALRRAGKAGESSASAVEASAEARTTAEAGGRDEKKTAWAIPRTGTIVIAGLAVAIVLVAAAIRYWPSAGEATGLAANGVVSPAATRIAVLPFQMHGMSDDEGLGAGMAQLLALNLDGLGPIETVDHRAVLERWSQSSLSREAAVVPARLAPVVGPLGATSALLGDLHGSGERVRIVADLIEIGTGTVLARANIEGPRDSLFILTDELTLSLLDGVWTAADIPAPRAAAHGTHSLVALKHYVRGEIHYRRAEWEEAVAEYRLAVREDSMFLPAVRALAETIMWEAQEMRVESADHFRRARELARAVGASERDRLFDEARAYFTAGDGREAVRAFEALAERYPDDFSIQYQVADAYFHFWPRLGLALDEVTARLQVLLLRDSAFAPSIDHLWWVAMWEGDEAEARRWSDAYMQTAPLGTRAQLAPIATAVRFGAEGERAEALERLPAVESDDAGLVVLAVTLGTGGDPEHGRIVARSLLDAGGPRPRRAFGAELMAALAFASGRPESGRRWLEEAERLGLSSEAAAAWRALVGLYGLDPRMPNSHPTPPAAIPDGDARFDWVRDAWLHGAVGLRGGDRGAVRSALGMLERAAGAATPTGTVARSLAAGLRAEVALADADTSTARAELVRALARYPELALLSAWESVPYYRYLAAQLESALGDHGAALAALHSLRDRTLGDLLYRPLAHMEAAEALAAAGEAAEAAEHYAAASRWWAEVEAPFAELATRARTGTAGEAGPH